MTTSGITSSSMINIRLIAKTLSPMYFGVGTPSIKLFRHFVRMVPPSSCSFLLFLSGGWWPTATSFRVFYFDDRSCHVVFLATHACLTINKNIENSLMPVGVNIPWDSNGKQFISDSLV